MAFSGVDIRKSGGSLIFRAFLQDGSSPVELVTSGTTALQLLELQADGTLHAYDFASNAFTSNELSTSSVGMTHQMFNDGATSSGIWTCVLDMVSGFTPGNIYFAQIQNSSAVPPTQTREFQYGLADGDLDVSVDDGGVTIHGYATGEDPAALLTTPLADLQSHGDSNWSTASGFAVPGSQMDFVNTPNSAAITVIQSGLATTANANSLLSAVNNLNNLSALANFFVADVLVRPASGTTAFPFAVVVRDSEGLMIDLDDIPTVSVTNAAGADRSANLSGVTQESTGVYTGTYTVNSTDADEGLSFVATGTVSSVSRRADAVATVASADSLAALAAIQAQTDLIGTNAMDSPNAVTAQTAAGAAATQIGTAGAGLTAIINQTARIGQNSGDSPNAAAAQANAAIAASQATTAATVSVTGVGNTATLLANLATVEGHAANADSQSATAATQSASAATSAATAAAQATSAATALGTAGSGLTNLPPVSLTSAYNLYLADVNFTKSSTTSTDDYTVVWSKNGIVLNSGVTDAAIQVNNQDGSTLLAQTGMAGPNSGIFYHNEMTNRTTAGAPVDVVVTATIDGMTRTYSRAVGRDA